jgi:hypothetical protein
VAFLLSPEARQLRPLLLGELVDGADLLARDQLRRAHARLPSLAPRLPLFGALPAPPSPPVPVPGRGLMSLSQFVEAVAPELSRSEEVYLQSVMRLASSLTGGHMLLLSLLTCIWSSAVRLWQDGQCEEMWGLRRDGVHRCAARQNTAGAVQPFRTDLGAARLFVCCLCQHSKFTGGPQPFFNLKIVSCESLM